MSQTSVFRPSYAGTLPAARTTPRAVAGERFEVLDSWRGICALLIALFHFPATGFLTQNPLVQSSYFFVDFFFVLSGFVIAASYRDRLGDAKSAMRFAFVRLGRVYPLHVVMLTGFVAFEGVRLMVPQLRGGGLEPFTEGFDFSSLISNVLLVHGLGIEASLSWNAPSWSISSEFFTYLLFAAVLLFAGRMSWIWLLAAAMVAPAVLLVVSPDMYVTNDFGFIRCIYGFSAGALLSWFAHGSIMAVRRDPDLSGCDPIAWTQAELAMIVAIVLFVVTAGDSRVGIAAPLVFGAAIFVFAHEGGWLSWFLRTAPLLRLGALSYSIYLVHMFIQTRMVNVAGLFDRMTGANLLGEIDYHGTLEIGFGPANPWVGTTATIAMATITVFMSYLTWRLIEMPALRWFKKVSKRIG